MPVRMVWVSTNGGNSMNEEHSPITNPLRSCEIESITTMTDFEERVVSGLSAVETEVRGLKEHLVRQNGSVIRIADENKTLSDRVTKLEGHQANQTQIDNAVDKVNRRWYHGVGPVIAMGLLMFLFMILENADKLKNVIFRP